MQRSRIAGSIEATMITETEEPALAKRKLILRDSLAFLSLVLVTLVLFGVTLLLFRSFIAHQEELAKRWSARGVEAMQANHPLAAVVALRTALQYAPDTREYELDLAQALGQAGLVDESYNYFMGLWQTRPGDGFINLELARLAARRGDVNAAVQFYRASIYGTWEGDGVARRAQVRLELARYLVQQKQYGQARMELLVAGGNSPDTAQFDEDLGELLEQAQDPADAWTYYTKALDAKPHDAELLARTGRLAYELAKFDQARKLLGRAETARAEAKLPPEPELAQLRASATRILALQAPPSLPNNERVRRILADRRIAKSRLDACIAEYVPPAGRPAPAANSQVTATAAGQPPPPLQALSARWMSPEAIAKAGALRRDPALQDAALRLVDETELTTAIVCQPPTGDDALLLQMAQRNAGATDNNSNAAPVQGQGAAQEAPAGR